ncbi:MAG: N-acetylgalactosamine-6-sulfatase [Gemmatales bacterium]|nr:MAG: N-acetylgalactosamine-6-sulfatase [Gemmatales bacterium]
MGKTVGYRAFVFAALIVSLIGSKLPASKGEEPARPNVLLILADDLGFGDLACCGATDMQTPNLDRFFQAGIRFKHFYANCPVCSPTRAALLTGRYQELVGVPGVIRTHPESNWGYLRPDAVLLPKFLKKAGYQTAIIGKWHLGLASPNTPNERGFDHFHGFLGDMMDDYYTHRRHGQNYMRLNDKVIDPKGHATDLFSEWACDYLRGVKKDTPFFLYLAYNAPHTPIQPPDDFLARVQKREPSITAKRAKLVALIEHLDAGIGKVLKTLDETGLGKRTFVLFTSDNGGQLSVGANNGPWRDGKGSMYEGGLRVPAAAVWPGRIPPGSSTDVVALSMDLFPTILDAAGVGIPKGIDGVSILPALLGKKQSLPKRDLFFTRREGGPAFAGKTIDAVRRGDWKLVQNSPWRPFELYHLAKDPQEQHNLAQKEPKVYRELLAVFQKHIQRGGAVPWQPPPK